MIRALLALGVLALAACAGAPKKPGSPPVQVATAVSPQPMSRPADCPPGSPYAPAAEDPATRGDYVAGGLYKPGVRDGVPAYLPRVECIPEPVVAAEPRSRVGNRSPYTVLGRAYHVRDSAEGFVESGIASYYGDKFHGRRTSNQEVYDMYAFTAAHKSLPLPSFARVTNLDNGRSVVVRVNDRGPFHEGRVIDLSYAAAVKLGIHPRGTGHVEVRGLTSADRVQATSVAQVASRQASSIDALVESLPAGSTQAREAAAARAAQSVPAVAGGNDWRFDMHQDGRTMTADDFDAWMQARGVRIVPTPAGQGGSDTAGAPRARAYAAPPAAATPASGPALSAPAATPVTVAAAATAAPGVVLQLAAFGARNNAERAVALLHQAGIGGARLLDGSSGSGQPLWRLRLGPVDPAQVAELSARVMALGFGPPHVVGDQGRP